ncbi:sulfite exporter TauE/SafE family protein [Xanthobacter wiegelii]|uniref:sulfite exporter TauE/SafE family protein n=1 Tax=Xanthobacter wiegelii TaxID=3119913 RepID=UPI0037273184
MIEAATAAAASVNLGLIAIGFAVLVLAGMVKGVIGMGLPTVGIGLLSVVLAPPEAAALLILPSTVTNFWQYFTGPNVLGIARRFGWMMAMVAAGTLTGGLLLGGLASPAAQPALGATLLAYGLLGLSSVQLKVPARHEPWLSPLMGFLTGLVTGTTGVSVMPSAPYLQSLGLARDDLVQALGLTFIVSTAALAVVLFHPGDGGGPMADPATALASAAALLPAFIGMHLGTLVRRAASPQMFRRIFFSGLGLLGVYMLARGLI